MDKAKEVETLIDKAAEAEKADAALKFSQAAPNAATQRGSNPMTSGKAMSLREWQEAL